MMSSLVSKRTVSKANASASGAGGRWFESSHPDQFTQGAAFPGSLYSFGLRSIVRAKVISN